MRSEAVVETPISKGRTSARRQERPACALDGEVLDERLRVFTWASLSVRPYRSALTLGPRAGAEVAGERAAGAPRVVSSRSAVSDGLGAFQFGGLAPGAYEVIARAPGYEALVVAPVSVALADAEPVRLRLGGRGRLHGVVLAESGAALAGVGLQIWRGSGLRMPVDLARTAAPRLSRIVLHKRAVSTIAPNHAADETEVTLGDGVTQAFVDLGPVRGTFETR